MQSLDDALFGSRWELLRLIAGSPKNPTELAAALGTSLANISQQLKLLEAYGLVVKQKEVYKDKRVGKPRLTYRIARDTSYLGVVSDGFAEKKALSPRDFSSIALRSSLLLEPEEHYVLLKFLIAHEDLLHKCDGIGLIKTSRDAIELFLHTEQVDEIRKKFSNTLVLDYKGKPRKIICWTHAGFEMDEGLSRKDPYFVTMFKSLAILQDRKGSLVNGKRRV
jgi:hypothetical protein